MLGTLRCVKTPGSDGVAITPATVSLTTLVRVLTTVSLLVAEALTSSLVVVTLVAREELVARLVVRSPSGRDTRGGTCGYRVRVWERYACI